MIKTVSTLSEEKIIDPFTTKRLEKRFRVFFGKRGGGGGGGGD